MPCDRPCGIFAAETADHTPMRLFKLRNLKECTLCLVTLAIVAGAPILVSVVVLVWG